MKFDFHVIIKKGNIAVTTATDEQSIKNLREDGWTVEIIGEEREEKRNEI